MGGLNGKEPTCQSRRQKRCRFNPWVGKIPWRRHDNPLQYSCLENPMDRGAGQAMVHRLTNSQTPLKHSQSHSQKHSQSHNRISSFQFSSVAQSCPTLCNPMNCSTNGTPLQYSCLENPMDRGAWWAAVYGITWNQTRLKRLSSSSSSRPPCPSPTLGVH